MRTLLKLVAVLLVLGVGADIAARSYAQGRIASMLATSLELDADPEVEIGGWPFLTHALGGSLPTLEAGIGRLRVRGITLDDARIELRDVTFSPSRVLAGDTGSVRAANGTGRVVLDEQGLRELLAREGAPFTIAIERGRLTARSDELGRSMTADASIRGSALVIALDEPLSDVTIDLPQVAGGITYRAVRVRDATLELELRLDRKALDLDAGSRRGSSTARARR
ncbi:MAG: DUF2993 domain-containing protein [Actinomycetota bacterium]